MFIKDLTPNTKPKYKLSKGLKKALYTVAAVGVGIGATVATLSQSISTETLTIAGSLPAIAGGITLAINWWKQTYKE